MGGKKTDQMPDDPGTVVRDALRGVRFVLRRSGSRFAGHEQQLLPQPIGGATARVAGGIGLLVETLERIVTARARGPLRKAAWPAPTFFGKGGFDPASEDADLNAATDALYCGLAQAARHIGEREPLISETICRECMEHLLGVDVRQTPAENAFRLFDLVVEREVYRTIHPLQHLLGRDEQMSALTCAFACALWFFLPRDVNGMDDHALLALCCDVAGDEAGAIVAARKNRSVMVGMFSRYIGVL